MLVRAFFLFSASLLSLSTFAGIAWARDSILTLVLAGEAYDGPPTFSVTFNGHVVGDGAVGTAIDTTTKGALATNGKVNANPQKFSFLIPESIFDPHAAIEVSFTNDKYSDVDGRVSDRNLYVVSADINGRTITSKEFKALYLGSPGENPMVGGMVELLTNKNSAEAVAPEGGWPSVASATAAPPPMPQAVGGASASTAAGKPLAGIAQPKPLCALTSNVMVGGFSQNAVTLTAAQTSQLDALIKQIRNQKCRIRITGYSDSVGANDLNMGVAHDRAMSVARYLGASGITFAKSDIVDFGPTRQFGPASAANRLVELQIEP